MSVKLMSKVWDMDIPINTKMVCLALCDQANDQGECYPSIATICKRCSLEERAVRRNIHALEEISVLWREYRTGHSTIYHLTPDKYQPTATPPHGGPLPMVDPPLQGTPPHGGPHPLPMADPPPLPMADPHNHQVTITESTSMSKPAAPVIDRCQVVDLFGDKIEKKPTIPPCPHKDIVDLYHEILPEQRGVTFSLWERSKDAQALAARWKEDKRHRSLDFWEAFFQAVRTNSHWMSTETWHGAHLRWLVQKKNFIACVERMVDNKRRAAHG